MREVHDGLAYDTTKAERLAEVRVGRPEWLKDGLSADSLLDPELLAYEEALYRTKSGRYFLHGRGNGLSRWSEVPGGEGIKVLTEDRAMVWAEKNAQDKYESIFGPAEEA